MVDMGLFSRQRRATATIRRIWHAPPPGAPWYYWTYVLFEVRGEPVQVKLSKRQAKLFAERHGEGETGHLVWSGKDLVSWEPASAERPLRAKSEVRVFLSDAHEWSAEAEYIAQVLRTHGLDVGLDASRLRTGDRLGDAVLRAIDRADFVVALLAPEYFASPWCMRELEAAADKGKALRPIKVSEGKLALPPHLRRLYEDRLGEPVYLDIHHRDPSARLAQLAEQLTAG